MLQSFQNFLLFIDFRIQEILESDLHFSLVANPLALALIKYFILDKRIFMGYFTTVFVFQDEMTII